MRAPLPRRTFLGGLAVSGLAATALPGGAASAATVPASQADRRWRRIADDVRNR